MRASDDYLSDCHEAAIISLDTMLDLGLDKKDARKLLDIIEAVVDVRLARLGLVPPQPPRAFMADVIDSRNKD